MGVACDTHKVDCAWGRPGAVEAATAGSRVRSRQGNVCTCMLAIRQVQQTWPTRARTCTHARLSFTTNLCGDLVVDQRPEQLAEACGAQLQQRLLVHDLVGFNGMLCLLLARQEVKEPPARARGKRHMQALQVTWWGEGCQTPGGDNGRCQAARWPCRPLQPRLGPHVAAWLGWATRRMHATEPARKCRPRR